MAPLSPINGEQGTKRSSCWERMPRPTPSWRPVLSLPSWSLHDATGFQGDAGARSASSTSHFTSPFPKSVELHCPPTTWQHYVIAALVYKQAWLFKCHCKKDAACSHLHIYSDHYSFLDLARKVVLPRPHLSHVTAGGLSAKLNLCHNWGKKKKKKDVRVFRSPQRWIITMTI